MTTRPRLSQASRSVNFSTGGKKHGYGLLKKVKLADKSKNLEMLGRYFKLFAGDREDTANPITTLIIDL
jgi:hypothetical protein